MSLFPKINLKEIEDSQTDIKYDPYSNKFRDVMLKAADTRKDGIIYRSEINNAVNYLRLIDSNGDYTLKKKEAIVQLTFEKRYAERSLYETRYEIYKIANDTKSENSKESPDPDVINRNYGINVFLVKQSDKILEKYVATKDLLEQIQAPK